MRLLSSKGQGKWVVAHLGSRDHYQLPIALHEANLLHRFVTDWYTPMDRAMFRKVMQYLPDSSFSALSRRYHSELPSRYTVDVALKQTLCTLGAERAVDLGRNRVLGESAARIASRSGSNLLITSYHGWAAFPLLPGHIKKVLFQIHPQPEFLRELYLAHEGGAGFDNELEVQWGHNLVKMWGAESRQADRVIATSTFTKKSLIQTGVDPERIWVVPYGVDSEVFKNNPGVSSGPARFLFIGQGTVRKGLGRLLSTWDAIGSRTAELHIVSGGSLPESSSTNIIWHERLPLADLIALINRCDLLVLPSIAEGFGHVLLEALACGTPILASDATAAPDLLRGWDEGFVFPAGDWDTLRVHLEHWIVNIGSLRKLRRDARHVAEQYTWANFREEIRRVCRDVSGT